MASSDSTSTCPESRAIRCHFASLAKAITDPLGLSMELYSNEIIEANTKEAVKLSGQILTEKNDTLLSAVERRVEARPNLFRKFVDILKDSEDRILRELGGKLETTYNQYTKHFTPDTKEQTPSTTNYPLREQCKSSPPPPTKRIKLSPPPLTQVDSPLPQPIRQSSSPPLATHPSLLPPLPQSPVCRYANYLRAFYQTSELPAYNKFPPTPSITFINLALIGREEVSSKDLEKFTLATLHGDVDQILHDKAPIQIEEILTPKPGKSLQCVLVEGAPGVGKTTLAWQACKQWGRGKLFQQFSIVMLLRLRDQTVQNAQSVSDLVFYQYHREEISQHLVQTDGRDILILLEGLDELPTHLLTQSSIFTRLLSGEELPHATILVTSRPSATAHLWKEWRHRVSKHIEVLGFTEENISQYIASILPPQQLHDLQDYLSMNTHIKTTMYIPLHAAIVIEVYRWCQHPRRPLPKTITQLYTSLVHIILRRYLDSHPDYKGKETQLQTIADLPPPVYAHFYSLTQLAYTGVTQQKLIFQDKDQPIHHLGFMDLVTELFSTFDNQQVSYSYNFLHLSIQEYLAAYYISTMEIHKQEQLLGTMCQQTHLQNMARFLAGITHFKDMDRVIVKKIIDNNTKEKTKTKLALELLYECRDASILDCNEIYCFPLDDQSPMFDFSILGYCITHSNCKWGLFFHGYMQSTEKIQMLVQSLNDHTNPSYLYSIKSIVFYCGKQPECVESLLTGMPQSILPQLHELNLVRRSNQPLPKCVPELIPTMSSLHTLKLDHVKGAEAVHRTVQALVSRNTLKILKLSYCDINGECVTTLCQWLSTSSQLEVLAIQHHPSPNDIEMISTALTTNSTLKELYINLMGSRFSLPVWQAMCSMLNQNTTITKVDLGYCKIDDDIIDCLADGLHSNNTLTTLDISHNSVGDSGAESIAQALHSNNTLTTLNISHNSVGDRGAESIAQALHSNNTLTTLNMRHNSVGDRGAVCMAEMLKINNTLQEINLTYNCMALTKENTNMHIKIKCRPQKKTRNR